MPNIAVISGCVLCHANFASGYVPAQIIYTASIRVNFTSASERIGPEVCCPFLTMITG